LPFHATSKGRQYGQRYEMTEEGAADRARDETDREGGVGQQQRLRRVVGGKEQFVEDQAGDRCT
jgi:hypothetical protein